MGCQASNPGIHVIEWIAPVTEGALAFRPQPTEMTVVGTNSPCRPPKAHVRERCYIHRRQVLGRPEDVDPHLRAPGKLAKDRR